MTQVQKHYHNIIITISDLQTQEQLAFTYGDYERASRYHSKIKAITHDYFDF